jgi:membrane protease YdiL (CAAX protease family)
MRPIASVILYFFCVIMLGALLAPPLYWGVMAVTESGFLATFSDTPFRRIANRSFLLLGVAGLPLLVRALSVRDRLGWGYGANRDDLVACIARGFGYGLLTMALLVALEYVLGILVWDDRRSAADLALALFTGLGAGLVIGLIEETFFRGILFTAFRRKSLQMAVFLPAFLYAGCHFISSRGHYEPITWSSGFAVLGGAFWQFGIANLGPFLALFAVGIFLALIREHSGHIGWAIGIHGGWVAIIRVGREGTSYNPQSELAWLSSDYDSITGYLSFVYLLAMILALQLHRKRRSREEEFAEIAEDVAEAG